MTSFISGKINKDFGVNIITPSSYLQPYMSKPTQYVNYTKVTQFDNFQKRDPKFTKEIFDNLVRQSKQSQEIVGPLQFTTQQIKEMENYAYNEKVRALLPDPYKLQKKKESVITQYFRNEVMRQAKFKEEQRKQEFESFGFRPPPPPGYPGSGPAQGSLSPGITGSSVPQGGGLPPPWTPPIPPPRFPSRPVARNAVAVLPTNPSVPLPPPDLSDYISITDTDNEETDLDDLPPLEPILEPSTPSPSVLINPMEEPRTPMAVDITPATPPEPLPIPPTIDSAPVPAPFTFTGRTGEPSEAEKAFRVRMGNITEKTTARGRRRRRQNKAESRRKTAKSARMWLRRKGRLERTGK